MWGISLIETVRPIGLITKPRKGEREPNYGIPYLY